MSVFRPTKVEVAYIYFKRGVRWRNNSNPFISGDAFADLCDYVYKPPKWRNLNRGILISEAKSIFCKSHELQEMLLNYGDEITARVIITGNSDFEFHSVPSGIPKSTRALFLQNSFISDDKSIFTIPIGLENFRFGLNGDPRILSNPGLHPAARRSVLFGPLSATHPIRNQVMNTFAKTDSRWHLAGTRLAPKEYDLLARKYQMVAAVRGNGVDTHRLWESLYRGVTPIVIADEWWNSLRAYYPQALVISDWTLDEIYELIQTAKLTNFDPRNIAALWMPFWEQKIRHFLRN